MFINLLVYPEGPRCVEGNTNALTVSEGVESGGREVTETIDDTQWPCKLCFSPGRECQVFRSRQSVGKA